MDWLIVILEKKLVRYLLRHLAKYEKVICQEKELGSYSLIFFEKEKEKDITKLCISVSLFFLEINYDGVLIDKEGLI